MRVFTVLVLMLGGLVSTAHAQLVDGPYAAFSNELITVPLGDHSISGLLTHRPEDTKFSHVYGMFAGHPSYGNMRLDHSVIKFDKAWSFPVLYRRYFMDPGVATFVIDAPSDKQGGFATSFRSTQRYADDVKAAMDEVDRRHGPSPRTSVGTSEGSASVAFLGPRLGSPVTGLVLTSTMTLQDPQGMGVQLDDVRKIKMSVLWVHHENDACPQTPVASPRCSINL